MIPKKLRELNCYELLDVSISATSQKIEDAYLRQMSIFSDNSLTSIGAISDDERVFINARIQEAYDRLSHPVRREEYDKAEMAQPETFDKGENIRDSSADTADEKNGDIINSHLAITTLGAGHVTGSHLRNVRIAKGTSIEEICDRTKIRRQYLLAIEEENEKKYPPQVFLKGYIKAYATSLGLDPDVIAKKFVLGTRSDEEAEETS